MTDTNSSTTPSTTTGGTDVLSQVSQSYVNLENAIESLFTTSGSGGSSSGNGGSSTSNTEATDNLANVIYNENVTLTKILNDAAAKGL